MRHAWRDFIGLRAAICVGLALTATISSATGEAIFATAELVGCNSETPVEGQVFLFEERSEEGIKRVDIFMNAKGLPPGKHAVQIHEKGSCTPCEAAGGHFDADPRADLGTDSTDTNHPFHSGDLINIRARGQSGFGHLYTVTTRITLSAGPLSIFDEDGAALVIHEAEDTYCPFGAVTGCAGGGELACGVIRTAN